MAETPAGRPPNGGPEVGEHAPEFTLQGIGGREWSLADERGRHHVVLLFYVLDWTPG